MNKKKIGSKPILVSEQLSFTLGDREFNIVPFSSREDAYDQQTEFLLLVTPLLMKILDVSFAAATSVKDIVDLNNIDILPLLREFSSTLPQLVAIICQGSDPSITVEDVKKLAKSLLNQNLLMAVIYQVQADNMIEDILNLKNAFGELGTLIKG